MSPPVATPTREPVSTNGILQGVRTLGKRPHSSHQRASGRRHHRDLAQMAARNEFRSDLYYRLNVFPVMVPPLRECGRTYPS
jgi:transcriptional regulator with AAA-type ATPase domain